MEENLENLEHGNDFLNTTSKPQPAHEKKLTDKRWTSLKVKPAMSKTGQEN